MKVDFQSLSVRDRYSWMISTVVPRPIAFVSTETRGELLDKSGTEFDPLVVKAFVNLMGLYPVGCLVSLDSGEVGTVVAADPA